MQLWLMLTIAGGYLIGYYTLNHQWVGQRKENSVGFWTMVENGLTVEEMNKELMKRFNREKKRRIRKGKEPITMEQFVEKMETEWKKTDKWFRYFELYFMIIAFIMLLPSILAGNTELKEVPRYLLPYLFIAFVGGWGSRKMQNAGRKTREQWAKQKREECAKKNENNIG